MKVIFNYTIPHTGTHFLMDMMRQGYDNNKWCQVDDEWFGNRFKDGALLENDFPAQNNKIFFNAMKEIAKSDDKISTNDIDLLLVKGHHWHRGTKLEKLLKEKDFNSDIKFISPIRDPFLSIMTRSWQGFYNYGRRITRDFRPIEQRKREARRIVQTFIDILTIDKDRLYKFPIDGILSKTEKGRMRLGKEIYSFCDLKFNTKTEQYINNWKPVNTSKGKSTGAGQEEIYLNTFEQMKKDYLSGDKDKILKNNLCNFEFEFLQKEEYLKRLMEVAGYRHLLWF